MSATNLEQGFNPNRTFQGKYNCIMYALGNSDIAEVFTSMPEFNSNIEVAFQKACDSLNIRCYKVAMDTALPQSNKQYLICLYWWNELNRYFRYSYREYHVIRRNPNGLWVHKDGFNGPEEEFPEHEQKILFEEFGNSPDEGRAFFLVETE